MATKRIRVAVCIDFNGNYNACGWDYGSGNDKDAFDMILLAQEGVDFPDVGRTFWLETTVNVPEARSASLEGEIIELDNKE